MKNNGNYQHHKKFFALVDTGFEYWQPEFQVLAESEKWIGDQLAKRFAKYSNNPSAYVKQWANEFSLSSAIIDAFTKENAMNAMVKGVWWRIFMAL